MGRQNEQVALSVIIPIYNTVKYLGQCLTSFQKQKLRNIEIVCVDDGSSDGSWELLLQYAKMDSRIIPLRQPHKGVSTARNLGIENSRGIYVLFADSDDYLLPNTLSRIYKRAVKMKVDILVFGGTTTKLFKTEDWILDSLFTRNRIYGNFNPRIIYNEPGAVPFVWNKLFRRALLTENQIRFNADIRLGEDQLFVFMAFPYAEKIVFTKIKAYCYRIFRTDSAMVCITGEERQLQHKKLVKQIYMNWEKKDFFGFSPEELILYLKQFYMNDTVPPKKFRLFPYLKEKGMKRFIIKLCKKISFIRENMTR